MTKAVAMVTATSVSKATAKSHSHRVVAAVQGHNRAVFSRSSDARNGLIMRQQTTLPWSSCVGAASSPFSGRSQSFIRRNHTEESPAAKKSSDISRLTPSISPYWYKADPRIAPYVQSCDENQSPELRKRKRNRNEGIHVCFLGTGSGSSTKRRPACTFVSIGREGLIFDVGEGSDRQIKFSSLKVSKISKIFITHLHPDHVLGLPGLLLGSNVANLFDPDTTLQLYGPPGLYNFVVTNMTLTQCKLRMTVEVYELVGGQCRVHWKQRGMMGNFPQFHHDKIVRKAIRCDEHGVWRIQHFRDITRETHLDEVMNDFSVLASELYHVPNVPTFGFVIEERSPVPRLDATLVKSLGLAPSGKYMELKNGFPVMNDDGTREIQPDEVLVPSPFKARKLAILGDNCGCPSSMAKLCENADLVVHEATLREENHALSVSRGHSTASMAGRFADAVKADLLVVTHLSDSLLPTDDPAKDALIGIKGGTRVLGAMDMMEVVIPRRGFQFRDRATDTDSSECLLPQEGVTDIFEDSRVPSKVNYNGLLPKEGSKLATGA
jgi:ribonuclease Z